MDPRLVEASRAIGNVNAFVDAARTTFSDEYRVALCKALRMPDTMGFADIIKVILSLFSQLGPILDLFKNCPAPQNGDDKKDWPAT